MPESPEGVKGRTAVPQGVSLAEAGCQQLAAYSTATRSPKLMLE